MSDIVSELEHRHAGRRWQPSSDVAEASVMLDLFQGLGVQSFSLTFTDDTAKRFEAYGWQVLHISDVNDLDQIESALADGWSLERARRAYRWCVLELVRGVVDIGDGYDFVEEPPRSSWKRAWRLALPSGQDVARAMWIKPLADKEILIGQGVDTPDGPLKSIVQVSPVFANNCPLWTYILAEAMHFREAVKIPVTENITINTPRLGPVGGRIVAEVLLGLIAGDRNSLLGLDPNWHPPSGPGYALKDFVKYALGL